MLMRPARSTRRPTTFFLGCAPSWGATSPSITSRDATLQLEASDRRHVAERLVLPLVVVVDHPDVQGALHVFDRVEGVLGEEALAKRPVETLHLACCGRRIGGGEEVADPV